ncbi:hypothetical protein ACK33D_15700 [Aeromonas hydrophila]|uniref:hypothetical protein n=1 Tax=Aeromonas hydrophila TaxID=644 RepID=UPI0039868D81
MPSDQAVVGGVSVGSLIEELLLKYPICGVGPLAWLEAADAVAVLTDKSILEILSRWVHLSGTNGIDVTFCNDELSISE